MKNIIPDKNIDNIQHIFELIDVEKPSLDFTSRIMARVALENPLPIVKSRTIPLKYYFLLTPLLLAIILFIPAINNWIADYSLNLNFINFAQITNSLNTLIQYFHFPGGSVLFNITITSTILIALMCGIDLMLDNIKNEKNNEIIIKE